MFSEFPYGGALGDSVPNLWGFPIWANGMKAEGCGVFRAARTAPSRQAAQVLLRLPCYWRNAKNAGVRGGAPNQDAQDNAGRLPAWAHSRR